LRGFERHGLVEGADGHFGLRVGRRLGGNTLEPETGLSQGDKEAVAAFGGKADHFVAHAHDQGQQSDARGELGPEIVDGQKRIAKHGDDEDHDQEAGAQRGCQVTKRCAFRR